MHVQYRMVMRQVLNIKFEVSDATLLVILKKADSIHERFDYGNMREELTHMAYITS